MPWTTSLLKGFVMFLAVNPFFAIFFTYDVIGALGSELEEEMGLQAEEIGWLYSAYSIFTPVMVFLSGLLIDKIGAKKTAMLMSSIMVGGTAVLTYGGYRREFLTMAGGRLAAGFGESLLVAMQAIIRQRNALTNTMQCQNFVEAWWLNMAFAMSNVWGQLGNASVFFLLPFISKGGLTLAVSVSSSVEGSKMRLSDIKEFPASFWCLSLINCLSTCSIFVSMSFGPLFLIETAGYSASMAGTIIALMNVTVLLAPIAGWILDAIGQRVWIWIGCCALMAASFAVLALDKMDPVFWLMLIGVSFAVLNSSVNAAISLVVSPRVFGTAYGICGVMFNLSLLIFPSLIGAIRNALGSFTVPMLVFAGINLLGVLVAVALFFFNRACNDNILNLTAHQIDQLTSVRRVADDADADDVYKPTPGSSDTATLWPTETTPLTR
ncbi:transporter, major facilitator subfamily protein [Acanthamoeba castellanii str. Neff]|uniref:Lysosomal dipeptide transporter MFSD1 n=1 Tax=Acanthamoeba castellanii (strain ATCC 30010 / Neff) TaxID=1257118 RepID=L8GWU0_ACACF|nr:transporter, major facilitator subfamily protein [Acanthamoeba castellanii str. Neff]ELR17694.1 transporter, major facilitator subfamily protein [Acanthamoeba castellanii str. Neff]